MQDKCLFCTIHDFKIHVFEKSKYTIKVVTRKRKVVERYEKRGKSSNNIKCGMYSKIEAKKWKKIKTKAKEQKKRMTQPWQTKVENWTATTTNYNFSNIITALNYMFYISYIINIQWFDLFFYRHHHPYHCFHFSVIQHVLSLVYSGSNTQKAKEKNADSKYWHKHTLTKYHKHNFNLLFMNEALWNAETILLVHILCSLCGS